MNPLSTILTILAIILSSCAKNRLDQEMEALCRKDGGHKVYEQIMLGPEEFKQGHKRLYFESSESDREKLLGPHYRLIEQFENVAGTPGNISEGYVGKLTTRIVRRADQKVIGESVLYMRIGGDGLSSIIHWQPSSSKCPAENVDIISAVFKEELKK